jgi:predicted lipoprotein
MKMKTIKIFLLIAVSSLLLSCKKEKKQSEDKFNRKAMLENYAKNLIKPGFTELQNKVNTLKTAIDAFVQNTNATYLQSVQTAWEEAYTIFQYVNAYNFGPAGEEGITKSLVEEIGTFPVSTTKIENAITNNNANFNDFNRDARGFLTLEYLIFDINGNNNTILSSFSSTNRKNFLSGVIANIQQRIDAVTNAWNGSYYNDFINADGSSAGSSTSLLYNEFVKSFENAKNYKLGIPLGKRPGQTTIEPTLTESYYSGNTLKMLQNHLQAIENIWYGKDKNGNDGIGFYEYLESVEGGKQLIESTKTQWNIVKNALNAIPVTPSISVQIQNTPTPIETLHTELQKHTRFFKSDMSSLLGIAITYSSGDGD